MTTKVFISKFLQKHSESGHKVFPSDFVKLSSFNKIKLDCSSPVIGNELFGRIEILSTEGETIFLADDLSQAKYIVYCKRNSDDDIKIPLDNDKMKTAVIIYEKYLDQILADIRDEAVKHSLDLKQLNSISNEIFRKLNLIRY